MNKYCEFSKIQKIAETNNYKIKKMKNNTTITQIDINSVELSRKLNKKMGKYTTIFCKDFEAYSNKLFQFLTDILQNIIQDYLIEISSIKSKKTNLKNVNQEKIKNDNLKFAVFGLGNDYIAADALGSIVSKKIITTWSKVEDKKISSDYLSKVFSLSPSISSYNGISTSDIIYTITKKYKPDIVFLIDSLSCKDINYLGKTFQITTSGLTPGCEIGNKQKRIDKKFLKVPIITIGCPLVIKVKDINKSKKIEEILTLKDINIVVEKLAKIISFSLNKVIHNKLTNDEIIFITKD